MNILKNMPEELENGDYLVLYVHSEYNIYRTNNSVCCEVLRDWGGTPLYGHPAIGWDLRHMISNKYATAMYFINDIDGLDEYKELYPEYFI